MNVQIEKFKTRFVIKCKYNEDIYHLFRNIKRDSGTNRSKSSH